jgi:hypothetical protein
VKVVVDRNQDASYVLRPGMNVEAKIRTTSWFF